MKHMIAKHKKFLQQQQFSWLITGVAGFIGSHLLDFLLDNNQKVIGIDNLSSGSEDNLHEVVNKYPHNTQSLFSFYNKDIRSFEQCKKIISRIDYVLHHAAIVSVPGSIDNPLLTNAVNVDGFINVLNAAKDAKVKKFVYASSSAIYGDTKNLPIAEEDCGSGKMLSPYAASKYMNEIYADIFHTCYGISTTGLRYFNVFGPRQNFSSPYSGVISIWLKNLLNNKQPIIYGDGETTRDFCYVGNVVNANILAALNQNQQPKNAVFNIGCGQQNSLNTLLDIIQTNLNLKQQIEPKYKDFRQGDIRHSVANINKAMQKIGYTPNWDLSAGIIPTIEWYKKI